MTRAQIVIAACRVLGCGRDTALALPGNKANALFTVNHIIKQFINITIIKAITISMFIIIILIGHYIRILFGNKLLRLSVKMNSVECISRDEEFRTAEGMYVNSWHYRLFYFIFSNVHVLS